MLKSYPQQELEARWGKDIREIVPAVLAKHRGKPHLVMLAAIDLGVSDTTVHSWCRQMDINLDDYRGNGSTTDATP